MHLRLQTKITLGHRAAGHPAVVGANSTLYVVTLTRQVIGQANERAQLVSRHVFFQAQNALVDSAKANTRHRLVGDAARRLRAEIA